MMHICDICDIFHDDDDAVAAVEVEMLRKLSNLGLNNCTLNFD